MSPRLPSSFVGDYKSAVADFADPCIRRLRGNPKAKILLITTAPTEEDIERQMPLSNDASAQTFHRMLENETGFSTEADMLVMSGTPYAKRATKLQAEPFRALVAKHARQFKLIACMGSDNFKFYFGNGAKSSMNTLASGTLIFLPELLGKTPIFVFPEINMLAPPLSGDRNQDWKLIADETKGLKWLKRLFPKFVQHTKQLGINENT